MRKQVVTQAILAYLERHPAAADSAAGVARWWLGEQGGGVEVEEVEAALAVMVQQGMLRTVRLADGTTLYARLPPSDAVH